MSNAKNIFSPDYSVPPGEILEEYIDAYEMTQKELAVRTGLTPKTINEIIQAKAPLTQETALKLERVFGKPAMFWNNLEQMYQEHCKRQEEKERFEKNTKWLKEVPVREMIKNGWIEKGDNPTKQLGIVLNFYQVDSPEAQEEVWNECQAANFHDSDRFTKNYLAVSAWLRRGEILAQKINCRPYDKQLFKQKLQDAKNLTTCADFNVIQSRLVSMFSDTGIAVVFVQELKKTHVWGATRWIRGKKKAVMQLSLRYKTNDHFWFTFFHEACHILKHGKSNAFIDSDSYTSEKEEEANSFAADFLIPPKEFQRFIQKWDGKSLAPIERFAESIGISPGIVVGRLQHDKYLKQNIGNKLKISFSLTE